MDFLKNKIMEKIILSLTLAAIAALTFTGCATTSPSQAAVEQAVVTTGVADGTVLVLNKNPKYEPDFVAGASLLQTIVTGTNSLSATELSNAFETAGKTNAVANMVILNALAIVNAYDANQSTNAVTQNAALKTGASWIVAGINEGLAIEQ
jgi:ABC-type spermidine/putrescine transport system permease subunit II